MTEDSLKSEKQVASEAMGVGNLPGLDQGTNIPFLFDRLANRIPLALVMIAVVIQLGIVGAKFIIPTLRTIGTVGELAARERAARLLGGAEFSEYIGFLRETIPEDGRVIIPPRPPIRTYTHVGIMQYFLFPREIHNCGADEVKACVERARGPRTYILAIDEFPPRALARQHRDYIPYSDALGVFAPEPLAP